MTNTAIVWLRNDLRSQDNPALFEAAQKYSQVIPVYIHDASYGDRWSIGSASKWWLHYSLEALSKDLPLILRQGNSFEELIQLISEVKPDALYWNRRYEPYGIELDTKIKSHLMDELNIDVKSFNANLLFEPWEIINNSGQPYKVFTKFWQACTAKGISHQPLPSPIIQLTQAVKSLELNDLNLLPTKPYWAGGFKEKWEVGEKNALKKLDSFIANGLAEYYEGRNFPSKKAVSELSPHLHFGEISPLYIWHKINPLINKFGKNATHFLSELGWREFSHSLLYYNPQLMDKNYRPEYESYPWDNDNNLLKVWQKGMTGYPIVDAGMRELWHTGYMHNRVRMIVGSFLTKDLFIDWRKGEEWFWDTLVDADLANNSASWQWVAGSGADAAPYYRIFNPVLQGEKFDPEGIYVKKWIPELAKLPACWVHKPWEAPPQLTLGYPNRVVDHDIARKLAMEKYKMVQLKRDELPTS